MSHSRWIVLKFGGTSVSSRSRWETIARVTRARIDEGFRPLVVCSALTGISNELESLVATAIKGDHEPLLARIEEKHRRLAAEMGLDGDTLLAGPLDELRRLALGVSLIRDANPKIRARILATGELLSTTLGAAFLRSLGLEATWCDARELLRATREPNVNE